MDELTRPLEASRLSPEAKRALSGPMKAMAARGLAPLADPRDLLSVLYQLSVDSDPQIRTAATKTARGLPENLTTGALAREDLDARVLNFFGAISGRDSAAAERIILNQSTADETIAALAKRASEREVGLIVANEERLLRAPAIIGALYNNANALQSIVDRCVELAIRNGVRVPGIAAWEELVSELMSTRGKDEPEEELDPEERSAFELMVRRLITLSEESTIPNPESIHKLKASEQIRIALVGPAQLRTILIRSRKSSIAVAAIKSPKVTEADAAKYAGNLSLGEEVIRYIASKREWTKNYAVKTALVNNPKCPMPSAMRFLPFLREREIGNLARSKNIPSALRAQAKKILIQRKGGGKGRR